MNRDATQREAALCRRNERRTFVVSVTAHALLFVILLRLGPSAQEQERLTEISLLEPGFGAEPSAPAPAAPAAAAPQTQVGVLREHKDEVRFRRAAEPAASAPDPQSDTALEDRLSERLATLQNATPASIVGLATVAPRVPSLVSPAGMPASQGTGGGAPLALHRGGGGGGGGTAPLVLARSGGGVGPGMGLAALPAEKPKPRPATVPPRAMARSSLAGASLAGPIADRPVLEASRPQYPEWAKSEAVEGSVTLYFVVSPDGQVQDNVLVQKTAGFQDFDDNAIAALRAWRFAPLKSGHTGDQWGTITFHFKLAAAP